MSSDKAGLIYLKGANEVLRLEVSFSQKPQGGLPSGEKSSAPLGAPICFVPMPDLAKSCIVAGAARPIGICLDCDRYCPDDSGNW